MVCSVLFVLGTIVDGSLYRLWSLHRDHARLTANLENQRIESRAMERKIQATHSTEFIEQQVRDQLDWVHEDDLVFVFADDNSLQAIQDN